MRNFFRTAMLSIAMLTLTLSSQAQVITAEQAQEIAEAFFAQGFKQTRSVAPALQKAWDSSVLTGSMQTRSAASDDPTFHAFTGSDGKGFVIVAGQETGTQIIGYSMDGTLPTDGNLPEGLTDYLTDIDNQVRAVRASGTTYTMTRAAASAAEYGTPVVELNTYPLSQDAPYNSVCSEMLGRTVVTGCVPTAFAMVMLHHKWPNTITKRIGYSTDGMTVQYINAADVAYDWANMFDSNGTLTTEGNNQVANMMFHLGAAYGVTWGSYSTDGQPNAYKMSDYFGYNYTNYSSGSSGMTNRGTAGDENWVTYIKESLDAGYPIPYQATNSGSGSDAKHIFILDGYTDNNYYHFNWGWGGSCNGYYTLSNMAPTSSDEYAGGGIANHNAVFMLRPNRGDVAVTATASPATAGTATVNGEASATIADGTQITLVATPNSGYTFLNWTLNGNVVSTSATYTPYLNGASDYVANFAPEEQQCKVSVHGNGCVYIWGIEETSIIVAKGTDVTVYALPLDASAEANVFAGWYDGNTQVSTEAKYTFTVTTDITLTAKFVVASGGTTTPSEYTISPLTGTFTNASGNSVTNGWASTYTFTVSNEMPAQITLTSTQNGTATNLLHANSFDFISTESSEWTLSVPEPYKIVSYSFGVTNSDVFYGIYPTISAETQSITLDRNNSSATFEVNDINKSTTSFTIKNGDEYNQLQISNFVVQIVSTTTGIENIAIENEESTMVYDLSGRRVQNPSRGIYIVNGKKVYIK